MASWIEEDDRRPGVPFDTRILSHATVFVLPIERTPGMPAKARLVIRADRDSLSAAIVIGGSDRSAGDGRPDRSQHPR